MFFAKFPKHDPYNNPLGNFNCWRISHSIIINGKWFSINEFLFVMQYYPLTVVNTTERLQKLREEMKRSNLDAYIIPSADAHGVSTNTFQICCDGVVLRRIVCRLETALFFLE